MTKQSTVWLQPLQTSPGGHYYQNQCMSKKWELYFKNNLSETFFVTRSTATATTRSSSSRRRHPTWRWSFLSTGSSSLLRSSSLRRTTARTRGHGLEQVGLESRGQFHESKVKSKIPYGGIFLNFNWNFPLFFSQGVKSAQLQNIVSSKL